MSDGTKAMFKETFKWGVMLILLFELVSLFGFLLPVYGEIAFLIVLCVTTALAVHRFDLAVLVLLAELFIGSQGGYLLSIGSESGLFLSLRIGLFLVIFAVWAAKLVSGALAGGERRKEAVAWLFLLVRRKMALPYLLLLVVIGFGALRGVLLGNELGNVFFDANAYAYFALLPAFVAAFSAPGMAVRTAAVGLAAVVMSVMKALFVLFIFSHRLFHTATYIYVWIRDTRVGEITIMTADYYRVFFQSQLFALAAIFVGILLFAYANAWRGRPALAAASAVAWAMVSMVLSLSRSFWFGGFAAAFAVAALLAWARATPAVWRRLVGLGLGSVAAAVAVVLVVYSFPYPSKTGDVSFASLLGGRAFSLSGEAAANSRWTLLPKLWEAGFERPVFGSGLGRTVTYTTSDPRLLADNPTGEYTTYAFEWGYHDLWVKFGLVGLSVYAWFIAVILAPLAAVVRRGRALFKEPDGAFIDGRKQKAVLAAGLLATVVAMLATNVFSPYLNHPLGIGLLMIVCAIAAHGTLEDAQADGQARVDPGKSL